MRAGNVVVRQIYAGEPRGSFANNSPLEFLIANETVNYLIFGRCVIQPNGQLTKQRVRLTKRRRNMPRKELEESVN